jgi:hypothetical protein
VKEQRALLRALRASSSTQTSQPTSDVAAGTAPQASLRDQQAAEAYMQGPFAGSEGILLALPPAAFGVSSPDTLSLTPKEAALPRILIGQHDTLDSAFSAEQRALASVATARLRVHALVRKLHRHLTRREIAAARVCPGIGVPVTYGRWAAKFLNALGAPVSRNNLVVMVAWQSAEGTMATWNPLATTYQMPGATEFNSVGVKNYTSLAQGIQAIILTLGSPNYGYPSVVSDLRASADPVVTAEAINASGWCHGCSGGQYVLDLVPAVEQYYASFSAN